MPDEVKVRSILWYVVALAIGISTPLLLLSVVIATQWVGSESGRLQARTFEAVDVTISQIDRYLAGRVAMLQALATSPAFDTDDFHRVDLQARELLDLQGANIVVRELDGQQRVNTRLPWGAALPRAQNVEADQEVLRTKLPYIADLYMGVAARGPLIRVVVPVLRRGEVIYTLTASLPPEALERLLKSAGIRAPYYASISDRHGVILARADETAKYVGTSLPGFAIALGERGSWSGTNPQGVRVQAAYRRSTLSGWLFTVGLDRAALDAPLYRSLWLFGVVAVVLCIVALLAFLRMGRTLVSSQRRVAETARSLELGDVVAAPRTPVREANEIGDALIDASSRLRAQAAALAQANHELEDRVEQRTLEVRSQAALLKATLDNMDQGLMLVASDGTVPLANRRALELLDLPAELLAGRPTFDAVLRYQLEAGEFKKSEDSVRQWVEAGGMEHTQHDYERERPNGTFLEIRTVPLATGGAVRTYTDVTERRLREIALRNAEAEYRGLFENAVVGIYKSTPAGQMLRANPALVRLNGFSTEQDLLRATDETGSEWYVEPHRHDDFLRLMISEGRVADFESEIYRKGTGERIWVSETAWTVYGGDGEILWFEGTVSEVTDRKRAEAEILHIASHDALTGLPNRSVFHEHLETMLCDRSRPPETLALLCLDLDRFKTVNDTLGHQVGDALLRQVAERIAHTLGPGDMAARMGGDEFAILQSGADQPGGAEMLAWLLIDAMSRPFDLEGRLVNVGLTIGIALPRTGQTSADQLVADADVALYSAKAAGRNRFSMFEPGMNARQLERRSLEMDLRGALDRSEFFLHFQPAITTGGFAVSGFEALVRWAHPVRGTCPPDAFIPLAEETGLIVKIGDWILQTACLQAASWPSHLKVAVNISAVQFASGNVRESVIRALALSKLAPERLELEITESVLLRDSAAVMETLESLRSYGVRIALDDFGTGFSSLGYLRQFNFDKIKIDRSFVADIANPNTLDIVRAIVSLARRRGMIITAEGIETHQQLEQIAAEGCTEAQGYLISRPMPDDAVLTFLESFRSTSLAA